MRRFAEPGCTSSVARRTPFILIRLRGHAHSSDHTKKDLEIIYSLTVLDACHQYIYAVSKRDYQSQYERQEHDITELLSSYEQRPLLRTEIFELRFYP